MFLVSLLSNWWLHLFNNDPVGLIPAGPGVTVIITTSAFASFNFEFNFYFSFCNPTTVALYVGRPVYIQVVALVDRSVNSGWDRTCFVVESEVPPLTTVCRAGYPQVTHVNNAEVGIVL